MATAEPTLGSDNIEGKKKCLRIVNSWKSYIL